MAASTIWIWNCLPSQWTTQFWRELSSGILLFKRNRRECQITATKGFWRRNNFVENAGACVFYARYWNLPDRQSSFGQQRNTILVRFWQLRYGRNCNICIHSKPKAKFDTNLIIKFSNQHISDQSIHPPSHPHHQP